MGMRVPLGSRADDPSVSGFRETPRRRASRELINIPWAPLSIKMRMWCLVMKRDFVMGRLTHPFHLIGLLSVSASFPCNAAIRALLDSLMQTISGRTEGVGGGFGTR
eukprot:526052-Rhodomonas_salina.1